MSKDIRMCKLCKQRDTIDNLFATEYVYDKGKKRQNWYYHLDCANGDTTLTSDDLRSRSGVKKRAPVPPLNLDESLQDIVCVYAIRSLRNGKCYIGSTTKLKTRIASHKRMLRNRTHHSYKLQQEFDRIGESGFVVEIIKEFPFNIERGDLYLEEQIYIDKYKAVETGFNVRRDAFPK